MRYDGDIEIGSITKMFTATAILQLCEQGKLSLDDTLDSFFPEFEYGKGITVYQLLHMQSGRRKDYVTGETFLSENGERDVEAEVQIMEYGFPDRYDTKREGHLIVRGEEPVKEKDT